MNEKSFEDRMINITNNHNKCISEMLTRLKMLEARNRVTDQYHAGDISKEEGVAILDRVYQEAISGLKVLWD